MSRSSSSALAVRCLTCGHSRKWHQTDATGLRSGPCNAIVSIPKDSPDVLAVLCECERFINENTNGPARQR